jgi:rubrerythrin
MTGVKKMETFEQWLERNHDELRCKAAESGADRELDFDLESFEEREYSLALKKACAWCAHLVKRNTPEEECSKCSFPDKRNFKMR